jgi:hypothetical protein
VSGYEQPSPNALPLDSLFRHDRLAPGSSPIFSGLYFGDLDKDSLEDFLYNGSEVDSVDTTRFIFKTYVAEYRPAICNFARVWSKQFYPPAEGGTMGYPVADFDNDERTDFMVTNLSSGYVFVAENTGNDQFIQVWSDSTPFVNLYYQGEGDVDGDGKREFFGGATMSTGNWTIVYEADGNNSYSAKFLFHLLSAGLLDSPIYLTPDVDHDGRQELVILSGNDLYIFKSRTDNTYYLWYLKRFDTRNGVEFYDFTGDKLQDFILNKVAFDYIGNRRFYAEVFLATSLVSVPAEKRDVVPNVSLNCYPNPFNSRVTIQVALAFRSWVDLRIYNVLGQEVEHLAHETEDPGVFTLHWSPEGIPSGVYLCRINMGKITAARKILLIR